MASEQTEGQAVAGASQASIAAVTRSNSLLTEAIEILDQCGLKVAAAHAEFARDFVLHELANVTALDRRI